MKAKLDRRRTHGSSYRNPSLFLIEDRSLIFIMMDMVRREGWDFVGRLYFLNAT